MNTSEALDLSKENIQPLKQGRNAAKLGTALQAQTNAELHQKLLKEREQFELLIRMYEGDDPLQPHYDYVHWIEQSYPKHGPDSNIVQILENTLTAFKDDERYKQDVRYAELLIKYIDTQPKPIEIYQLVYNQGLCTMCAPFYKAWADELDKNNDFKTADKVFELGIRVKAQPLDLLKDAHLRFQLSVGRRMLGHQEEPNEEDSDYNRQALHKLQKKNIYGVRGPVGGPGQINQQPLNQRNGKNSSAPFKVYQGDDDGFNDCGESQGKMFPKRNIVHKENTLKPGPWTQHGGKHRTLVQPNSASTPTFQVHEDEGSDMRSMHPKTPTMPRALKPRKIDNFTCPLAVFEPPDPTKKPMYCKSKVYAGGTEFQFEELRAALYNRRYEQLAALKIQQDAENQQNSIRTEKDDSAIVEVKEEVLSEKSLHTEEKEIRILEPDVQFSIKGQTQELPNEQHLQSSNLPLQIESTSSNNTQPLSHEELHKSSFETNEMEKVAFGTKPVPEANASLFHCQSFTVNTKEAMNVVQEMWNSPSPAPVFGKNSRPSRAYPMSPLDESGVFKVPAVPPRGPEEKLTAKPFEVFCDDEPTDGLPPYSEDRNENNKKNRDDAKPLQLFPPAPPQITGGLPGMDAATMKMLAFQSDSEDSCDDAPPPHKGTSVNINTKQEIPSNEPKVLVTVPTPDSETNRVPIAVDQVPQLVFHHDEDRYEDLTCNTKAFDFVLPSSTPFIAHSKPAAGQSMKSCINGSYIADEAKNPHATKQDLSMIFEASKERYSSSSGSSGSKTQGSVCTAGSTTIPPVQAEVVEKLAQISANKSLDELEKSVGLLKISEPVDPFSTDLIAQLLSHIQYPKKHHLIGLHVFDTDAPPLHCNSAAKLGNTKYSVIGELGKGNYARVLKATRDGKPLALKQQRPAWEWEWYIVQELQIRLPPNMMGGFLHMTNGYIYKNASILESEWAQFGSILSVVNKMKIAGKPQDLQLAVLFSIQLISIVEHLHKCQIIHGDIKPDNFVLCSLPSTDVSELCLKLIDFGRSIDMSLFPEGTSFTTVVTTDGFQCNEMKEGRPWTYQTDLYGLAGSIYCVLFFDYMKVVKKDKKWQISNKIPRYMMPAMWQEIFNELLNVESCEALPDLSLLRGKLEEQFKTVNPNSLMQSLNKLSNTLQNK